MDTQQPLSVEGKMWYDKFGQDLFTWISTGFVDEGALQSASDSLKNLFERCPDFSNGIQHLALMACYWTNQRKSTRGIEIAKIGLDAANVASIEKNENIRATCLLLLFLSEMCLQSRQSQQSLGALKGIQKNLENFPSENDVVLEFIQAKHDYLRGYLLELSLENSNASEFYEKAYNKLFSVINVKKKQDDFFSQFINLITGTDSNPNVLVETMFSLLKNDNELLLESILSGQARTFSESKQDKQQIMKIWQQMLQKHIPNFSDIELALMFQNYVVNADNERYFSILVDIQDILLKINQNGILNNWIALLLISQCSILCKNGNSVKMLEIHKEAENAISGSRTSKLIKAIVYANMLVNTYKINKLDGKILEKFIQNLNELGVSNEIDLTDLRTKSYFDEAISIAIEHAFNQWKKSLDVSTRIRFSVLLDLLRQPSWNKIPSQDCLGVPTLTPNTRGLLFSLDRLGRIKNALTNKKNTTVIVLQTIGRKIIFIGITGKQDKDFVFGYGDETYLKKSRELAHIATKGVKALARKKPAESEKILKTAAMHAFDSLPPEIKQVIENNDIILLIPDFRSDEDSIPFEIMHDGERYLGIAKIVSRMPSLRHAMFALENTLEPPSKKRALVISAPDVIGFPALNYADLERENIIKNLKTDNWDVPKTRDREISPDYLVDRLDYLTLLHVIGHGEVTSGNESLILPKGRELNANHIIEKYFRKLPFVYLNTCNLGQTRYLGGGVSKGIPYAIISKGGPSVIANLSLVDDKSAMEISEEFYENCNTGTVGQALRKTRQNLNDDGMSPLFWGSTVLFGDPTIKLINSDLHGHRPDVDLATRLLDAYSDLKNSHADRQSLYLKALKNTEDNRLCAAVQLINSLSLPYDLASPNGFVKIDEETSIALELNHRRFLAILRYSKARNIPKDMAWIERFEILDEAIKTIEPLSKNNQDWFHLLTDLHSSKRLLEMERDGLSTYINGPALSEKEMQGLEDIHNAILGAQSYSQHHQKKVQQILPEESIDDICWNAIIFNHPNKLEDMRERREYFDKISKKLSRQHQNRISSSHIHHYLCGIIPFLWDIQNITYLDPDLAEGQKNALLEFLQDLDKSLQNSKNNQWFEQIKEFPNEIDAMIEFLIKTPYSQIYDHISEEFGKLDKKAAHLLELVKVQFPEKIGLSAAYIIGSILIKNIFSYTEGSIPEEFDRRFNQIYSNLILRGEEYFDQYLSQGFKIMHSNKDESLVRWNLEDSTA